MGKLGHDGDAGEGQTSDVPHAPGERPAPGEPHVLGKPHALRLDDQLCFALYAATNAVTRAYRPLLGELGLTYPQYLVMLVLWQDGPSTTGRIAQRLQLAPGAVTPLVDRLVARELLTKTRKVTPGSGDRRTLAIELTDAGRDLEAATSLAQQAVECRTALGPGDLAALRGELHALVRRMDEAAQAQEAQVESTSREGPSTVEVTHTSREGHSRG